MDCRASFVHYIRVHYIRFFKEVSMHEYMWHTNSKFLQKLEENNGVITIYNSKTFETENVL